MNKLLIIAAVMLMAVTQKGFAQDSTKQSQAPQLLSLYYNIKDALVAGNTNEASASAQAFVQAANSNDNKSITANNLSDLVKEASGIADTKDLRHQREHFAGLSTNMVTVVKAAKLTDQPVYQAYCPMKKSCWLTNSKTIKNPYFGSAMPTCGKITETL